MGILRSSLKRARMMPSSRGRWRKMQFAAREEQRRSFQTASRALKEETERSDVLKARVKDLERDLSASLSVSAQLRRSLSDMQAEKEDAMRSSRKAQGEIDMLASTFESVQREGQTLQADIIKERRSFLEHQRATSREIESLTERLDRSYRQAAKATAKRRRSNAVWTLLRRSFQPA